LNRHAVRPTTSLNVLYDHRDRGALLARRIATEVSPFDQLTEFEKSSLSNRTTKMFTLSAIYQATVALFAGETRDLSSDQENSALEFWKIVGELIRKWGFIGEDRTAADLRRDCIHVHAVALHAIGAATSDAIALDPSGWQARLKKLEGLNWARSDPAWDGRAIRNGRISKAGPSLVLTANLLRKGMGVPLSDTQKALEETLEDGRRGG
jgi:DNA sulfur modification protein DndB